MRILWSDGPPPTLDAPSDEQSFGILATMHPSVTGVAQRDDVGEIESERWRASPRCDMMGVEFDGADFLSMAPLTLVAIAPIGGGDQIAPLSRPVEMLALRRGAAFPCGIVTSDLCSDVGVDGATTLDAELLHVASNSRGSDFMFAGKGFEIPPQSDVLFIQVIGVLERSIGTIVTIDVDSPVVFGSIPQGPLTTCARTERGCGTSSRQVDDGLTSFPARMRFFSAADSDAVAPQDILDIRRRAAEAMANLFRPDPCAVLGSCRVHADDLGFDVPLGSYGHTGLPSVIVAHAEIY